MWVVGVGGCWWVGLGRWVGRWVAGVGGWCGSWVVGCRWTG